MEVSAMCSSVISEFNIEIRNLISVFRFKFLQLIYAIIKKRFRIFRFRSRKSAGNEFFSTLLSFLFFFFVRENCRLTRARSRSSSNRLLALVAALTFAITYIESREARKPRLLARDRRVVAFLRCPWRILADRGVTVTLESLDASSIVLIRFPMNQTYFARGRTICRNLTAWSSFVMITICNFILFSTRSFVISDWTILVFISRSCNILQRFRDRRKRRRSNSHLLVQLIIDVGIDVHFPKVVRRFE